MHPISPSGKSSPEYEAFAIAKTMPKLKRVEIANHLMNTNSFQEILSGCPELEFLDLRGCWNVGFAPSFFKERYPKLTVLGPVLVDKYDERNGDRVEASDFSNVLECLALEFEAGEFGDYYDDFNGSFDEISGDERWLEEP